MIQRSMKAFASFFFLYTVVLCIHLWLLGTASSMLQQNETDRLVFIAFKAGITLDPLGMLSFWNDTLQFYRWLCVLQSSTCQPSHQINLFSYGLVGSLSPHIRNLTLERQSCKTTASMGKYPLNRLFRLRVLFLSNNSFQGAVPTNITHCSELKEPNVVDNKLEGKIPEELGSLSKLRALGLANINLTGRIPASLGNLSSLTLLLVGYNNLEGSIPEELGKTTIERIQLGINRLTSKDSTRYQ